MAPVTAPIRKHPRRRTVLALILIVALVAVALFARNAGRWLVCEDPLAKADVIVVLSGSMPYRAEEAARVFRGGYAPEVWVSYPISPAADLDRIGIHYIGEEEYNRDILIREGVPPQSIRIFPDQIFNTAQEVTEVSQQLQRAGESRVIFVTSPEHTRRVRTLWRKLAPSSTTAILHAAPGDPFDSAHWWRNTHDALALVREYLGLMNAWAGLPVRPQ